MLRIAFWNLNHKDLTPLVCDLALSTTADVIVLNECDTPIEETERALRSNVDERFFVPRPFSNSRFQCLCRDSSLDLTEVHCGSRTSVRRVNLGQQSALLALVHGVDIRNYDAENRQALAQRLADDIRFVGRQQGNGRFILMGDFNMNPFDPGMHLATCMNAMMTKSCVAAGKRKFQGEKYDFYYNPMWSLFGDNSEGPAGTFFDRSSQGLYGWNMLDQVLINYLLVPDFRKVCIVTCVGSNCLTDKRDRPDRKKASDHLPIVVEMKGTEHE